MKKLTCWRLTEQLFAKTADALFPPSDQARLVRNLSSANLSQYYQPDQANDVLYICPYSQPVVRAAITEHKFHRNPHATACLVYWLQRWVNNQKSEIVLVPIPLGKQRLRERGHNQVESVLKKISRKNTTVNTKLLKRTIETNPQSSLPRSKRLQNVQNAFSYCGEDLLDLPSGTTIVLVDDVLTTGATMGAARATLAPHLPPHTKLICLAIAH